MDADEVYKVLVDQGRIGYGKKISQSVLETLFGVDYDEKKPMRYMALYIELQRIMKSHGYVPTNRWCSDKGLLIKREDSYFRKIRRDRDKESRRIRMYIDGCQSLIDRNDCDNKTLQEVRHEMIVTQTIEYAQKSILSRAFM